ncbi:pyridoxamine 5'-phosphate oxidase family protein [Oerskovia sp. M15]
MPLETPRGPATDRHTGAGPAGTLVERFSSPGAVAVPWEDALTVLQTAEIFWLSTVRPDGRPTSRPSSRSGPTAPSTSAPGAPSARRATWRTTSSAS